MPTIKDVAAAAGVSPTTVSLVMNGRGEQHRIPADTIARIQNAMRELGYQPNLERPAVCAAAPSASRSSHFSGRWTTAPICWGTSFL